MRQLTITPSITNRDARSLEKYLVEIGKLKMITAEREVVLAQRIRSGDLEALHELTTANLRFVVSVAKQYQFQGLPLSDIISEGNIGLIKAGTLFDESKGFKFISYAVWWIRQSILKAIVEKGRMIHLPMNRMLLSQRIHKANSILEQDLERPPTEEELAAFLDVTVNAVKLTSSSYVGHSSLDAPKGPEAEGSLLDSVEDPAASADMAVMHHHSLRIEIERTLSALTPIEKDVICLFFGIGSQACSLQEISEKYQYTAERIRQIREKALKKLRNPKKLDLLRSFLCQ